MKEMKKSFAHPEAVNLERAGKNVFWVSEIIFIGYIGFIKPFHKQQNHQLFLNKCSMNQSKCWTPP